jgi:signal transduction histidine kinase
MIKKVTQMVTNDLPIKVLIHDLKNPLILIMAGARSLLSRQDQFGALTDKQKKIINRILRNAVKGNWILEDVFEMERAKAGVFSISKFSFLPLLYDSLAKAFEEIDSGISAQIYSCEEISNVLKVLHGCGVELNIPSRILKMELLQDEGKVRQIIKNLILNGLRCRNRILQITVDQENDSIFLSVSDDGPGIEPKHHRALFDRYFQLELDQGVPLKGHGLGLAGVKALVGIMKGKISLESGVGNGTTFVVSLPCRVQEKERQNDA